MSHPDRTGRHQRSSRGWISFAIVLFISSLLLEMGHAALAGHDGEKGEKDCAVCCHPAPAKALPVAVAIDVPVPVLVGRFVHLRPVESSSDPVRGAWSARAPPRC